MKSLFLMRHAKADSPSGVDDFDRPLAPRGREAAARMAREMAAEGYLPDLILCSAAQRTRETHALTAEALGNPPVRFVHALYLASPARLLKELRQADDDAAAILLIGHNPGVQSLAIALTGDGDGDAIARLREKFSTAAVAILRLPADRWHDLAVGAGRLEAFMRPRELRGDG